MRTFGGWPPPIRELPLPTPEVGGRQLGEMGADGTRSRDDRTSFDRFKKFWDFIDDRILLCNVSMSASQSVYHLMLPRFKLGVQRTETAGFLLFSVNICICILCHCICIWLSGSICSSQFEIGLRRTRAGPLCATISQFRGNLGQKWAPVHIIISTTPLWNNYENIIKQ